MSTTRRFGHLVAVLSLVCAPLVCAPRVASAADQPQADLVRRGEYLTRAGDCYACHTGHGAAELSGGLQVLTPFGTISSPNLTPDKDTGIGTWSDDDFYRALHDGIGKGGEYLYPVMPFDHYTKVTRDDALAIKAYLFSLKPVHNPRPPSHLEFPFSIRTSLLGWRQLFFQEGTFKPDPKLTEAQNRGAYLVEGLGHCGACHTPRNVAMGSIASEALGGGEIKGQGWFAPNITSDVREGIGGWSQQQLFDYLKKGVAPGKAVVAGPMGEVVHESLAYLSDADVNAIAAYLKVVPAKALYAAETPGAPLGGNIYLSYCADCHQPNAQGIQGAVPPLAGNGVVRAGGPEDVIRTVLGGLAAQGQYAPMPGFAAQLTSQQIAEVTNYVRASFGNGAPSNATTEMVDRLSADTHTQLAGTGGCLPPGPPAVANAIASQGITPMLQQINAGNVTQQIDAILPKLATAKAPQADVVNGLTNAFCPIVMHDSSQPQAARVELLQRFTTLIYSQLTSHQLQDASAASQ